MFLVELICSTGRNSPIVKLIPRLRNSYSCRIHGTLSGSDSATIYNDSSSYFEKLNPARNLVLPSSSCPSSSSASFLRFSVCLLRAPLKYHEFRVFIRSKDARDVFSSTISPSTCRKVLKVRTES